MKLKSFWLTLVFVFGISSFCFSMPYELEALCSAFYDVYSACYTVAFSRNVKVYADCYPIADTVVSSPEFDKNPTLKRTTWTVCYEACKEYVEGIAKMNYYIFRNMICVPAFNKALNRIR